MATSSKVDTNKRPAFTIERYNYQCDNCGNKFNWDANCRHGGTYRDIEAGKPVATFCCAGCKTNWKSKQPQPVKKS